MRAFTPLWAAIGLAATALQACAPAVPDSGQGVGFTDYNTYMRQRQAELAAPAVPASVLAPAAPVLVTAPPQTGGFTTSGAAAAIANASGGGQGGQQIGQVIGGDIVSGAPTTLQAQAAALNPSAAQSQAAPLSAIPAQSAVVAPILAAPAPAVQPAKNGELAAVRPRGNAPEGIAETVSEMAAVGGVSDEQDFEAVSARETIESDKARIEANRAKYQIDQPTALPQRDGSVGPSIVEYALATQHPVGVKLFRRSALRFKKPEVACAPYATDDLAQEAFLAAGGPDRDRMGVDPDGDGYACGWNPAPFRAVAQ